MPKNLLQQVLVQPPWFKGVAGFWAQENITNSEFSKQ